MAKQLIESKWLELEEIDVTQDSQTLSEVVEKTGQTTVPQIFIWDKFIWWYDDLNSLEQDWKLDELISESA